MAHVRKTPKSVRLVSAADQLHTARSILAGLRTEAGAVWRRFTGGKESTLWYYRTLVDTFKAPGRPGRIVEELESVLEEIEEFGVA